MTPFDLSGPLPSGRTVLEASAGTGKTYSLTGLIVRYLAEAAVSVDQLLVVTFTRAAANELRERTRVTLELAAHVLRDGAAPDNHAWMTALLSTTGASGDHAAELERRGRRVADAITHFDELTITTIHGFCQQALAQLGVRSGFNPDAILVESLHDVMAEACRDAIVTELADDPARLNTVGVSYSKIANPRQAEIELINGVGALTANPGSRLMPANGPDVVAANWVRLTVGAHKEVARRQEVRNEIGYDTLISGLQRALTHPEYGPAVAAQLAQRSSVVLVDEFQDTDRLQWEVFERAFSGRTLITVGDPKQAIYRFRGADVHAYLEAIDAATTLALTTNHRSDQAVLNGLARLFDGATLGDPRIRFVPVHARPDAPFTAVTGTGDDAAVHLRVVPLDNSLRGAAGKELSMPLVRSLVLDDLVSRVVALLDQAELEVGASSGTDGINNDSDDTHGDHHTDRSRDAGAHRRRVEPGDIAVLVPSHAEANHVAAALRQARIPAVRTRTGSVLQSPAALQWRLLLNALAQPHQTPLVRAAALGWFLHTDVATLAGDDAVLAALQSRAAELAVRMRAVGVSAFYEALKARVGDPDDLVAGLVDTLLGRDGGDRDLTDLDHISELLAAALQGRPADPALVLRVLDQMISDTDDRNEAAMRRIDSDALAVQITTIHSAKGLEYPIVLVPFGFKPRGNIRTPYSYTDPAGGRVLDLASRVGWDGGLADPNDPMTRDHQELRRHRATLEVEGDELRLLYVALTRARHRVEIWWACTRSAGTSALARVLTDRYGAGSVQNTEYEVVPRPRSGGFTVKRPFHQVTGEANVLAQIKTLARDSDGVIACTVIPAQVSPGTWAGHHPPSSLPLSAAAVAPGRSVIDPRWTRWSFSRMTALAGDHASAEPTAADTGADERTDRGGFDEPVDHETAEDTGQALIDDEDASSGAALTGAQQLQLLGVAPTAHLADVPGGTRFGTFVHAVLERLDPTADDLAGTVRALVVENAAREGLDLGLSMGSVVEGLVAAVRTPLGPLFDGRSLAQLPPRDRLAELTFDLPIASARGVVSAGDIGRVLLTHLPPQDPVHRFARQLRRDFAGFDLAGWMHGSIDGVFRVDVGGRQRFVVVDYKTNRLHEPGAADPVAAYHPKALIPAMEHSRYPLQALIYMVAVHRYLRWRLADRYDPEQHLGGTAYLFVRGMVGTETPVVQRVPHGVFSWRPPAAAVLAVDELLATGAAA